jgi:uncharacterized protein (TIGR02217 family)
MANFNEISFPSALAFGSNGGPKFSTQLVESKSGFEQRNVNWSAPRMAYNAATSIKNIADYEVVRDFFYIQQGRARGFRFKDWSDYRAEAQILGVADGERLVFVLQKRYSSGAFEWFRVITKPVVGTVNVYVDGVLQASGFVVDSSTGVIAFDSAPVSGSIVSGDFEFDVPVRFDVDHLEASFVSENTLKVVDIPMIEVLL